MLNYQRIRADQFVKMQDNLLLGLLITVPDMTEPSLQERLNPYQSQD
jgi:hypothetical protein